MQFFLALLSFVTSFGLGFLLVSLFWPKGKDSLPETLLKVLTAVTLGMGATAALFFLWLVVVNRASRGFVLVEVVVLGLLGFAVIFFKRRRPVVLQDRPAVTRTSRVWPILALFFLVLSGLTITYLILKFPTGAWDALAIWNIHAKFLASSMTGQWRGIYDDILVHAHQDYPFLTPAFLAQAWVWMGTTSSILPPAFVTLLFSLGVPLLLFVALSLFRSTIMGVLAMGFLLVSPTFLASTFLQYSDIPVGFYFLLSTVLLIYAETLNGLANTNIQHRGLYALAGFSAGCAALTKNEGLLFLLVFVAAWALQVLLRRELKQEFKKGLLFLAAAGFFLVPLGLHKASAPTNDLVGAQTAGNLLKIIQASRHEAILASFVDTISDPKSLSMMVAKPTSRWPLLCGLLFVVLVGIDERLLKKTAASFVWSIALFLWLGYYFIYLTTPSDLTWHLATSMERLQVQTFPLILLAIGLSLRRIEARTRKDTDAKDAP
ncbi:MAG TPA: phospholipid carrier-dependent glycosyltransferase [Polyangia bacterium]|jgi:Dolichyl-phosphate-mannose-protein mannosyltransferase.|nr:phospholipid carrier-dependent glycosyltransferase [Polyangia bacterium]